MAYQLEKNKELTSFNTMGIRSFAEHFVSITTLEDLRSVLHDHHNRKLTVIGGGSNILLTSDVDGLVLKIDIKGIEIQKQDENHTWIEIGGGEIWHDLVLWSIDKNLGGIENLSLIPGTVGAAPMQNIGAYGVEIREVFESLVAVEIETGETRIFDNSDCEFGYRTSVFKTSLKGKYIIASVCLKLNKKPVFNTSYGAIKDTLKEMGVSELSLRSVSDAVIKIRQSKLPDPAEIGNAGSFFKNPVIDRIDYEGLKAEFEDIPGYEVEDPEKIKVPAGWLIERCGWKGKRFGDAGVHDKQALVLVNLGEASGDELKNLAYRIRESVSEKFGILIEPEVNLI